MKLLVINHLSGSKRGIRTEWLSDEIMGSRRNIYPPWKQEAPGICCLFYCCGRHDWITKISITHRTVQQGEMCRHTACCLLDPPSAGLLYSLSWCCVQPAWIKVPKRQLRRIQRQRRPQMIWKVSWCKASQCFNFS